MSSVSLVEGWLPVALLALGALAAVVLLARRGTVGVVTAVAAVGLAALTFLGVNHVVVVWLGLDPEPLPTAVRAWSAAAVGGLALGLGNLLGASTRRRLVALVATVAVLVAAATGVNLYFAAYPTLGALVGEDTSGVVAFPGAQGRVSATEPTPAVQRWGDRTPGRSVLATATIPGTVSGFDARDAYVYLPPAYGVADPPLLPVLVLVAGQPGGPGDWIVAGRLREILDGFAARHGGLAPVTVVVDPNGSDDGNTMCLDSRIAQADTYLAVDVPAWITAQVGVDTDHARWTFGGFSFGGTCAVQMASRHPDLYPSFVDVSGEREPALTADRTQTIAAAFGGDTAAFDALTPLTLFGERRYPQLWGYFAAGADDPEFLPTTTEVAAAARAAGATTTLQVVPGLGHSWEVPIAALDPALEWLGARTGLVAPPG